MSENALYQERLTRCAKAFRREVPDKVPFAVNIYGWAVEYYGYKFKEVYRDKIELAYEVFSKLADEFEFDGYFSNAINVPFAMTEILGDGLFRLSDKGVQGSNHSSRLMEDPAEYELLGNDVRAYFRDVITPRKFPSLAAGDQKAFETMMDSYEKFKWFGQKTGKLYADLEAHGIPVLQRGGLFHPVDLIMDHFRDFSGIIGDMRRRPDELKKACDALYEYFKVNYPPVAPNDGHLLFWPLHLASYLKPKDFKEFYFPYLRDTVDFAMNTRGFTVALFMEGNWEPYYDILQELPDNDGKLIGLMEKGDFKGFKKAMGNKLCIAGGIPIGMLGFKSKQECIDHTKRLLEDCAPGGGFVVSTDAALLNLVDAKPENLKAVIQTVNEYGKY